MTKTKSIAVVVMSGGQDSTTCLGVALQKHDHVAAISFDYGQKHAIELEQAKKICDEFAVLLELVEVPLLKKMDSSALVNGGDTTQPHAYIPDVPASFVPVRNALFLTMAYGFAMEIGAETIYTGVCQTDYSGYPDCRAEFVNHLNDTLIIGYGIPIKIETPLMYLTKAQTFALAEEVGILGTVLTVSHTCYDGDHTTPNEWGFGCGECPACKLRAKGWEEYKASCK